MQKRKKPVAQIDGDFDLDELFDEKKKMQIISNKKRARFDSNKTFLSDNGMFTKS
jgi:hypothetical protein